MESNSKIINRNWPKRRLIGYTVVFSRRNPIDTGRPIHDNSDNNFIIVITLNTTHAVRQTDLYPIARTLRMHGGGIRMYLLCCEMHCTREKKERTAESAARIIIVRIEWEKPLYFYQALKCTEEHLNLSYNRVLHFWQLRCLKPSPGADLNILEGEGSRRFYIIKRSEHRSASLTLLKYSRGPPPVGHRRRVRTRRV